MKVMLGPGAYAPTRAHSTDAGLDLYSREDKYIPVNGAAVFDTGVHIELPPNTYGKLESKSGLNVGSNIVSLGGVIDQGYRGSIKVKLYNMGDKLFWVTKGMKIVQLVICPCLYEDVDVVDELDMDTQRGEAGFGSTGVYWSTEAY